MANAVGLIDKELKEALENISGKTITGNFQTTAEMLHAFNDLYACKTTFNVLTSDGAPLTGAEITVKQNGEIINKHSDGKYYLKAGSYTYDSMCEGYTDIVDTAFTISSSDVTRGTKSITVQMTAVS